MLAIILTERSHVHVIAIYILNGIQLISKDREVTRSISHTVFTLASEIVIDDLFVYVLFEKSRDSRARQSQASY